MYRVAMTDEPLPPTFDGALCRAARSLLALSQLELCERAQVSRKLLNDFENGLRVPKPITVASIREALERPGAVFVRVGDLLTVGSRTRDATARSPRSRGFAREAAMRDGDD